MAQPSKDQISFLKSQAIAPAQVFDASRTTSKIDRESQMSELELSLYFGDAVCKKGGHTLRTKAGHCIQCDTSKIAYQFRHSASGYVYLAHSTSTGLTKVGFTKSHPQDRAAFLRREQYAKAADWNIKRATHFDKDAGRKEFTIHARLEKHLSLVSYEKYRGQLVECREVFSCELRTAIEVYDQVVKA